MNEHAGPACALSVLIVGLFAVLLHDRGHTPSVTVPIARKNSDRTPQALDVAPPAQGTTATPSRETPLPSPRPASTAKKIEGAPAVDPIARPSPIKPETTASPAPPPQPPTVEAKPKSSIEGVAKRPTAIPVRTAFTVVLAGEKLADVATRVYGSSGSTEQLWKANRDQVAQIDSALPRGTLLRTP